MVSALLRISGPGSGPGRGHCVVFLGNLLSRCLSSPNFKAGGNPAIFPGGSINTPSRFINETDKQ